MNMHRVFSYASCLLFGAASISGCDDGSSAGPDDDTTSSASSSSSGPGGGATSANNSASSGMMGSPGSATLRFSNVFDGAPLTLGTEYATADDEPFSFSMIRYWVSNVTLSGAGEHADPDSYYLVEATAGKTRTDVTLENIPPGEYTSVTFGLGVDAAHNHSTDVFVGELSTAVDMDWGWNSGFIFVKTEGQYFNDGSQTLRAFAAHIGTDANYKTVTLPLPQPITVDGAAHPVVTIQLEASALANGFDFNTADNITFGPQGPQLMNIFAGWFAVAGVE